MSYGNGFMPLTGIHFYYLGFWLKNSCLIRAGLMLFIYLGLKWKAAIKKCKWIFLESDPRDALDVCCLLQLMRWRHITQFNIQWYFVPCLLKSWALGEYSWQSKNRDWSVNLSQTNPKPLEIWDHIKQCTNFETCIVFSRVAQRQVHALT